MPKPQKGKRQLAAIMFTDIAGYTALMGIDEKKAFNLLRLNREIQKPIVAKYEGQWIKELGDGVLASFSTATNAVLCAAAIQKAAAVHQDLRLRIGIHLGDIIFEHMDVYGDGVNIASRLQALAPVGEIYVSESVFRSIANKSEITGTFVTEEILRNVSEPVRIYAVQVPDSNTFLNTTSERRKPWEALTQLSIPRTVVVWGSMLLVALLIGWYVLVYHRKPVEEIEKSIAVLPFVNMSGDPTQEYFSDGLSEEIINALAQAHGLKVIARTSSFQFKGKNEDLREIGKKLGVATILEGSVRKDQSQIRITAQLVRTTDGTHIWSKTFQRTNTDIFSVQDEIAQSVFESLKSSLELDEPAKPHSNYSFEAYDLFLKAREENRKFHNDPQYLYNSIRLLEEALRIEPDFPEALTLLGYIYIDLTWIEGRNPVTEGARSKLYLEKSLSLNPGSSDAYIVLGAINFYLNWNMPEAKRNFEKGWGLSNYGAAPISQCFCPLIGYTAGTGNAQQAISYLNTIDQVDPEYPFAIIDRIIAYRTLQDTASLRDLLQKPERLGVYAPVLHYELENYDKAIEGFLAHKTDFVWPSTYLASAYFKNDMVEKSDSLIRLMIEKSGQHRNVDFGLAVSYAARGDTTESLKWFISAYEKRDFWMVYARTDTDLRLIIDKPEVQEILVRMGLLSDHR